MKKLIAILVTTYLASFPVAHAQEVQGGSGESVSTTQSVSSEKHVSKFGNKPGHGKGKGHKSGHNGKGSKKGGKSGKK